MSFYIILDTLEEIVSNDKLPRLRWEYEAQNDLLPILFTGCLYVMFARVLLPSRTSRQSKKKTKTKKRIIKTRSHL